MSQHHKPRRPLPYRAERMGYLTSKLVEKHRALDSVQLLKDKAGKPIPHHAQRRIRRAIEVDIAYLKRDIEQMDGPGTGLSYVPRIIHPEHGEQPMCYYMVGKPDPSARIPARFLNLPPFDTAWKLWMSGKLGVGR